MLDLFLVFYNHKSCMLGMLNVHFVCLKLYFLGYVVSEHGIEVDHEKVKAIES